MRATFMQCPSDLRGGVPCKYRASQLWACLPTPPRLHPLPVPSNQRFACSFLRIPDIAPGTLAVRLPRPRAGCGGDFHPRVTAPTTTWARIAPVTAHQKKCPQRRLRAFLDSSKPRRYAALVWPRYLSRVSGRADVRGPSPTGPDQGVPACPAPARRPADGNRACPACTPCGRGSCETNRHRCHQC